MPNEFFPPRKKSLAYNGILAFLLIGLIFFLLISGSMTQQNTLAIIMIVLGLLLLIPLILVGYRIFTILTTGYTLDRDALELSWGLRRELLPLSQIEWVHPISDFETPLPLGSTLLRGSWYTQKDIKGLGSTLFIATAPDQMMLIKDTSRYVVISPESAKEFSQRFEQLSQMGSLQTIQPESENLKMLWQRVWADTWAKRFLLTGAFTLMLVFITSLLISLLLPRIVWVSMEYVPSSRAMLISVIALFFALINTFAGLLIFLRDRFNSFIHNLIWVWSIIINLIFIAALIFMAV